MSEIDLRWAVQQFRNYIRDGEKAPFFEAINAVMWRREPDFSRDYRRLYEIEQELSDTKVYRAEWELVSIWRLARDESYARWAKSIGIETAQMTFFGAGETQDWFCRRRGAWSDSMIAIERLLNAGIKPRLQFFLTKKILPEFDELMRTIDRLRLRARVQELGGNLIMFVHTPAPSGEARFIEHLRPTMDEASIVPSELIEQSKMHLGRDMMWRCVGERVEEILSTDEPILGYAWDVPKQLFFCIQANWDVYANIGTEEAWWKLGNLKTDSMRQIMSSLEEDKPLGLRTISTIPLQELAKRYGDPESRLIDGGVEELWLENYCEELSAR